MWSGSVFNTHDDHDFINVVFQCRHLNRIIIGLEMSSIFRELHQKEKENFTFGIFLFIRKDCESWGIVNKKELINLVFFLSFKKSKNKEDYFNF